MTMDATIMARVNELAQLRRVFNQILASFDELPFSRRKADLEAEAHGEILDADKALDVAQRIVDRNFLGESITDDEEAEYQNQLAVAKDSFDMAFACLSRLAEPH
jgi:hypothetical protein